MSRQRGPRVNGVTGQRSRERLDEPSVRPDVESQVLIVQPTMHFIEYLRINIVRQHMLGATCF
jgi:hypothetical protein